MKKWMCRAKIKVGEFEIAFLTDGLWRNDGGCMFGVVPRELWQAQPSARRAQPYPAQPDLSAHHEGRRRDPGRYRNRQPAERGRAQDFRSWRRMAAGPSEGARDGAGRHHASDRCRICISIIAAGSCGGAIPARSRPRFRVREFSCNAASSKSPTIRATSGCAPRIVMSRRFSRRCADARSRRRRHRRRCRACAPSSPAATRATIRLCIVSDGGECFMHLADIVPTRSHMRGPWNQAYDLDALRTMEQKAHYLGRASRRGWWLSFAHDDTRASRRGAERSRAYCARRVDRDAVAGASASDASDNQLKSHKRILSEVTSFAQLSLRRRHWLILLLWTTGFAK